LATTVPSALPHSNSYSTKLGVDQSNSPGSLQINGNGNFVKIVRQIVDEHPGIKKHLTDAIEPYLYGILGDKNRIPIEVILTKQDQMDIGRVPLPAVFTMLDIVYRNQSFRSRLKSSASTEYEKIPAVKAVAMKRHLVVIGDPGSGKTTLVNYLCVIMAALNLSDQSCYERLFNDSDGEWDEEDILFPISIRLKDFAVSDEFNANGSEPDYGNLVAFIINRVARVVEKNIHAEQAIRDHMSTILRHGGALIVLDGLDELPGDYANRRLRLKMILDSFAGHPQYGKCRVVVTSRSYAYKNDANWHLSYEFFDTAQLRQFEIEQIEDYVTYWYRQIYGRRSNYTDIDKSFPICQNNQNIDLTRVNQKIVAFIDALKKNTYMLDLARSPLLLAFIVSQYGDYTSENSADIPRVSRAKLYKEIVGMLIERWALYKTSKESNDSNTPTDLFSALGLKDAEQLEVLLATVAFEAQANLETGERQPSINRDMLERALQRVRGISDDEIAIIDDDTWRRLEDRLGILLPDRKDSNNQEVFVFAHHTFQEWLAAVALNRGDPKLLSRELNDETSDYVPLSLLVKRLLERDYERWREVISLALEDSPSNQRKAALVKILDIKEGNFPINDPDAGNWYGSIICGQLIEREQIEDPALIDLCNKWLIRSLQFQTMSVEDRILVSDLLMKDKFIDFRVSDDLNNKTAWDPKNWLDSIDNMWAYIPDMEIDIGSPPHDSEAKAFKEERRPNNGRRQVKEFFLSKYHITNQLYNYFLEYGYLTHEYWKYSDAAYNWFLNNKNEERELARENLNMPKVNVTWYEAVAFCLWFSEINPYNLDISLISEIEWVAAAHAGQDLVYIWGNDFIRYKANIRSSKIEGLLPIGVFNRNDNNIYDMCGNVAEWTTTVWQQNLALPENDSLDMEDHPKFKRTVRGSHYRDLDEYARIGYRRGYRPNQGYEFVSFRIMARQRE
jgi:formylglycine-generating enzyme required for sulfatase activity/energy-coupling factor transporter ATP-binding protein EcfA2